jgi:phytoene desaturase
MRAASARRFRGRTVSGPTGSVVVVGAGLGGLSCAIRLAAAGRDVTVLERADHPGGRAGRLVVDGYEFDTGPTVLTMPDIVADLLGSVGEELTDWLDLTRLDPAYRAHFADGSTIDVIADTRRMAAEVSRVCGPREADGYLRFVDHARRLWRLERRDFIDRNLDSPRDLLTANLVRLLAAGGLRRMHSDVERYFRDERLRRIFSFQAMYAGLAPHDALALYTVIAYLDSVAGVYFPRGGVYALAEALARVAEKHGVSIRYATGVSSVVVRNGRARGVRTSAGELVAADVVVLNPDLPVAYRDLLPADVPAPRRLSRLRYSPSCVVLHVGSARGYDGASHHNIHFGRLWRETFDEVIRQGRLMSDPSLLVTNPTRSDPTLAPAGRHTYYVLAPVPNLAPTHGARPVIDWRGPMAGLYRSELIDTLERRGYPGFGGAVEVCRMVTPADWAEDGMAAGTPFAAAHTLRQTGPFRPANLHPALDNVVFVGSGTQPGVGVPMVLISGRLAAERITGGTP